MTGRRARGSARPRASALALLTTTGTDSHVGRIEASRAGRNRRTVEAGQSRRRKFPAPAGQPAEASSVVGQDEIEELLKGAGTGARPAKTEAKAAAAGDSGKILAQGDIEALLNKGATQAPAAKKPHVDPAPSYAMDEGSMAQGDIELLLHQAERALASVNQPSGGAPAGMRPFELEDFAGATPSSEAATLELIRDVELDLKIELGRTHMYLEDVLKLRKGSVVPLDKLAGDPVDIFVNGRLIARGEVLVLNDNFCVRVAELLAGETAAVG